MTRVKRHVRAIVNGQYLDNLIIDVDFCKSIGLTVQEENDIPLTFKY